MDYSPNQGYNNRVRPSQSQARFYRNRSNASERGTDNLKNSCPICLTDLTDIIAYQPCSHVLCFECAVRNRVLCDKKDCPVCRAQCNEVVLAGHRHNNNDDNEARFGAILEEARTSGKSDPYYGFIFENITIERAYRKMLTHACRFCDRPFTDFPDLVRHMRERHDHYYCEVCIRVLMLFTWEHKLYQYDELMRHLEEGDPTDKNIPPHPKCQLCTHRAFDKDELYRHSKKHHHLCWVCDQDSTIVRFFDTYFTLFEHMADQHFVCKTCSSPADGQVICFGNKEALDFHLAEKHGGKVDPWMVLNLQSQTRRRGERDRDGAREDAENVEPLPIPPPTFNMDVAQFPTLGNESNEPSDSQQNILKAVSGKGKAGDNSTVVTKPATAGGGFSKFSAPRMTENEFPALGGSEAKKSPVVSTSWSKSGPKITASLPEPKSATQKVKKEPGSKPPPPPSSRNMEESFPQLGGPSSAAVAKLNHEWQSVPVKSKKETKSSAPKPIETSSHSRWDVLDKTVKTSADSDDHILNENGRSKTLSHVISESPPDLEEGSFPSLAAPSKKQLPAFFKTVPPKPKPVKHKQPAPAPFPSAAKAKATSEREQIAASLFKTSTSLTREVSENGSVDETPVSPPPVAAVIHAAPYKMKKDDFPGLEMKKAKDSHIPKEIQMPDKVKKNIEVKTKWGNTVIQTETVYTFIRPSNAKERSETLYASVEPVQFKGKLKSLAEFEKDLLDEKLTALEFWMECQRLMGKKFVPLMTEEIALLPSISTQQDLYDVAKMPIYGNPQVLKHVTQCRVCQQVVKTEEKDAHEKVHKGAH